MKQPRSSHGRVCYFGVTVMHKQTKTKTKTKTKKSTPKDNNKNEQQRQKKKMANRQIRKLKQKVDVCWAWTCIGFPISLLVSLVFFAYGYNPRRLHVRSFQETVCIPIVMTTVEAKCKHVVDEDETEVFACFKPEWTVLVVALNHTAIIQGSTGFQTRIDTEQFMARRYQVGRKYPCYVQSKKAWSARWSRPKMNDAWLVFAVLFFCALAVFVVWCGVASCMTCELEEQIREFEQQKETSGRREGEEEEEDKTEEGVLSSNACLVALSYPPVRRPPPPPPPYSPQEGQGTGARGGGGGEKGGAIQA